MNLAVLERTVQQVFKNDFPKRNLSIVWHAGEPLMVAIDWYREALDIIDSNKPKHLRVQNHFQTNAVLIDDRWCDFIKKRDFVIGISVDGPREIHDANRIDRKQRGSFDRVMKGVERLRFNEIPFHVICVLTHKSLLHPDQIIEFFSTLGISQLCFNIEEIESNNTYSSLQTSNSEELYVDFFKKLIDRINHDASYPRIREIENILTALKSPYFGSLTGNTQNLPGRILTVDYQGNYTTWSPEMLGMRSRTLGALEIGSVFDEQFPSDIRKFQAIQAEIDAGVDLCRKNCLYFDFCLGGSPGNKLGEHGSFNVAQTMYCRISQKRLIDCVVEELDRKLPENN